jgi:Carboxypeptidase regulatory-like domain
MVLHRPVEAAPFLRTWQSTGSDSLLGLLYFKGINGFLMQNKRKVSFAISLVFLVALFSPLVAHACSIFYPTVQVGTEFRVRVMDRGRPIRSLKLVLDRYDSSGSGSKESVFSITDAEGYARFSNLTAGSFFLTADHDGGVGDGIDVNVRLNGATNVTVPLNWPNTAPLQVRSTSGTLRGPDYYPQKFQPQLSLSLLEGVSGRVIETTQTDSKGRFRFANAVTSGIYFLQLTPSELRASDGEQIEGMIPIEINPNAAQDVIDLDLGWSSCGLGYAQRAKSPEMKVSKVCGDVTDAMGAVISNSRVMLLANSENGEILEQTRSGTDGQFALSEHDEGTYQLLVKSPGFQPFVQVMRMGTSGTSEGCQKPIHVRLTIP